MGLKDKMQFKVKQGVLLKYRGSDAEVAIPAGIHTVKDAFSGNRMLRSVRIPAGIREMRATFKGCANLERVVFEGGVENLYNTFEECTSLRTIAIPQGVTLMHYAFRGCSSLVQVDLPESLKSITGAFSSCKSLASIRLPHGLVEIGDSAFYRCTALVQVELPDTLESIDNLAFNGCASLVDVRFPAGLKRIGDYAFSGCKGLRSVSLPDGIALGGEAFEPKALAQDEDLTRQAEAASRKLREQVQQAKQDLARRRVIQERMRNGGKPLTSGIPTCPSCGAKLQGYAGINSKQAARAREREEVLFRSGTGEGWVKDTLYVSSNRSWTVFSQEDTDWISFAARKHMISFFWTSRWGNWTGWRQPGFCERSEKSRF